MAEHLITISTRKYLVAQPRTKRIRKAAAYVRERVSHYMKVDIGNVRISKELNNEIVKRYAKSMSPLKLSVTIDNNIATVNRFGAVKKAQPIPEKGKPKGKEEQKAKPKAAEPQAKPKEPKKQQV